MSELWVAVTAEYRGATFSHRAQGPDAPIARDRAVHHFDLALDESAWCVRAGLAGWLPPQWHGAPNSPLSEHEKLREIQKIVNDAVGAHAIPRNRIQEVLDR
jgi:hypothetical protein